MWSDGRVDANMRSASTFPELKARLKDLIFRFLPSTCNCGAREPLTYSGKLRLHAPSGTLDGNWTLRTCSLGPVALRAAGRFGVHDRRWQERGRGGLEGIGIGSTYCYSSSSKSSSTITRAKSRFLCDKTDGIAFVPQPAH